LKPPLPAVVTPLAPERYKVLITVSRETYEKLRRVQDLLRHTNPSGDPAMIFDRALTVLLEQVEKRKCAAAERPRTGSERSSQTRHIPAGVKRGVWTRDAGQCTFVGTDGRRCGERGFLEFHHVVPFADGGDASVGNIALRCKAHNGFEADLRFGAAWICANTVASTRWGERGNSRGPALAARAADDARAPGLSRAFGPQAPAPR
jgi:hypothetical protein